MSCLVSRMICPVCMEKWLDDMEDGGEHVTSSP